MDDLRQIWQDQEVEEMKFSVEELRAEAAEFRRRFRERNLILLAAGPIMIVILTIVIVLTIVLIGPASLRYLHSMGWISLALVTAGLLYVMWYVWTKAGVKSLPEDIGRVGSIDFYRAELVRQRDLAASIWKWYIVPLVPGIALFFVYMIENAAPAQRWGQVLLAAVTAAAFGAAIGGNQREARRLDRRIAELDRELQST